MTVWYCDIKGGTLGPLNPNELLAKIREGVVVPDTPLRKDDSQWVPALEVSGLFAAAARPVVRHVCPYCNADVPPVPCECENCQRSLARRVTVREASPVTATGERNPEAQQNKGIGRWVKRLLK